MLIEYILPPDTIVDRQGSRTVELPFRWGEAVSKSINKKIKMASLKR